MKRTLLAVVLAAAGYGAESTTAVTDLQLQTRVGMDTNPVGAGGTATATWGDRDSMIYGATLSFAVPVGATKFTYAGEMNRFGRRSSENYDSHRLGLTGSLTKGLWKFSGDLSSLFVEGNRDTLASLTTVNANAITLWRERRHQQQYRAKLQASRSVGQWMIRGIANVLDYDYGTNVVSGYVSLADRSDITGGADVGWKPSTSSLVFTGARWGRQFQDQVPLPNCAFDYSNTYRRIVAGIEAKPTASSTLTLAMGPSFHHYTGDIDPRVFVGGRDRTSLWFEGTGTSKVTDRVTLSGKATRMAWLSSTGKSAYVDTCAETSMTFAATKTFSIRATGKIHQCDYYPTVRDDFESFVGAGITWKVAPRATITVDALRHRGWNNLDSIPERTFGRFVLMVGATFLL